MPATMKDFGIDQLPPAKRAALALEIWESLGDEYPLPLTNEQKAELTRRDAELDSNPAMALTWAQIRASSGDEAVTLHQAFHPDVRDEIDDAHDWHERQRAGRGADFLNEVERVLQEIAANPARYGFAHANIAPGNSTGSHTQSTIPCCRIAFASLRSITRPATPQDGSREPNVRSVGHIHKGIGSNNQFLTAS